MCDAFCVNEDTVNAVVAEVEKRTGQPVECACHVLAAESVAKLPEMIRVVYYGTEVCERGIPDERELAGVFKACSGRRAGLVLVTPPMSDAGIVRLRRIVKAVVDDKCLSGVVLNDYGAFVELREAGIHCELALGRVLTRQYCDPKCSYIVDTRSGPKVLRVALPGGGREITILVKALDRLDEILQGLPALFPETLTYLKKLGVSRFEVSNTYQGIDAPGLDGIALSLHYPLTLISTGRICWAGGESQSGSNGVCARQCWQQYRKLRNPLLSGALVQAGVGLFYSNEKLPEKLTQIDRVVLHEGVVA